MLLKNGRPVEHYGLRTKSKHAGMKPVARWFCVPAVCLVAFSATAADPAIPDSSDSTRGIDLTRIDLALFYQADFSQPLKVLRESALFENKRRVREPPPGIDWVLEGSATARINNGRLYLMNEGGDLVFWNTRRFPADFLLEFEIVLNDSDDGLNIVFFSATARDGRSIFELSQKMRDGAFERYHSGQLNAYHTSYWATRGKGYPRGTAHIRKNHGFHLVAIGKDFIAGEGPGPHRVRILKLDGRIEVEVNGRIAVQWQDDGQALGPVLREGFIGLRQMAHTRKCGYTKLAVWAASARDSKPKKQLPTSGS